MSGRRKPSWPLWFTVAVIGLPVLYVLSFGPACWMVRSGNLSIGSAAEIYRPLIRVVSLAPDGVHGLFADLSGKAPRAPFGIAVSGPSVLHRLIDTLRIGAHLLAEFSQTVAGRMTLNELASDAPLQFGEPSLHR